MRRAAARYSAHLSAGVNRVSDDSAENLLPHSCGAALFSSLPRRDGSAIFALGEGGRSNFVVACRLSWLTGVCA